MAKKSTKLDYGEESIQKTGGFDSGTILGIVAGIGLITLAIILGGDSGVFANLNAVLIVLGGCISTTFIAFQSTKILEMVPVIKSAFRPDSGEAIEHIDDIMDLAEKYRKGGMKVLELSLIHI